MISIISPVYNSKSCLKKLVEKIVFYTNKVTNKFEIILVDDGSEDGSWEKICKLKKKYNFLKGIKLSKNYGQQQAIYQGLKSSTKKIAIIMDCDLQDNPAYIVDLFKSYMKEKKPAIIKHSYKNFKFRQRIFSNIFWYFLSAISLKKFYPNFGNYILIDDKIKLKYLSIKNTGYLYGDLVNSSNKFISIKKERNLSYRKKSTYNLFKLIKFGTKLIIKYNLLSNILKKNNKSELSEIIIERRI